MHDIFESKLTLNQYFTRVFLLMGLGVFVSAITGFGFAHVPAMQNMLYAFLRQPFSIILTFALQLGIVFFIRKVISERKFKLASILYFVYAVSLSITFAVVFLAYTDIVIFQAFVGAVALFVSLAVIGFTTSKDLTKIGTIVQGALLALFVVTLINIFIFRSSVFDLVLSYIGLIIFLVLTAYDVQKLKAIYYQAQNGEDVNSLIIWGAFMLYLDFVNIFLYLLRILGNRD